ncbi:unnamed protein product [Caenorhabditis bovis]|uniref:Uncharacterized protein n=1 Tax=Caenorhabditis bovis TaxID=2654633 RepID=A0A8S1F3F6_9PELO|nr:unnamed protein product [Caenorhabditis bovis]
MSTSRKPLIRNNSHADRHTMRNWPLFAFLIGLVLFFYIFYVYQAQSTALSMANDELRSLNSQLTQTKSKLVDTLSSLESANTVQKTMGTELEDLKLKKDECSGNLRSSKLRLDTLEKENKEKAESNTKMESELSTLREKSEELVRNNTALAKMIAAQEVLIQQLNQTVTLLQFETSKLRVTSEQTSAKEAPAEEKKEEEKKPKADEPHTTPLVLAARPDLNSSSTSTSEPTVNAEDAADIDSPQGAADAPV